LEAAGWPGASPRLGSPPSRCSPATPDNTLTLGLGDRRNL
jgi:hypothetical protein